MISGFTAASLTSDPPLLLIGLPLGVLAVLWILFRAAKAGNKKAARKRKVFYPKTMRHFVWIAWVAAVAVPCLEAADGKIRGTGNLVLNISALAFLVLLLHLEVYHFGLNWDGYWIYTVSRWRRPRRIPLSTVTHCEYSHLRQMYRIFTRKNGIIRVPIYTTGIPELLALLPVPVPPYPPGLTGCSPKAERDAP